MKNAILTIVTLAVLGCHAQYKTMLHAEITPTNSVVVDIPDWAKSDTPPISEDGTLDYNTLTNKPSINGTTIEGSLTTEDLGITTGASDYNDLTNKPSINGVTLTGDKTTTDLGLATPDEALLAIYYPEGNVTSIDQITTERLEYTYDDATMTATLSNGFDATGDVVIPWKVTKDGREYKVTAIGEEAFCDYYNVSVGADITNIIAPTTVISIGDRAIYNHPLLTSASFPSVTSIGGNAFSDCSALESASFPSVTSIGDSAFSDCSALESASFPSVTSIGDSAFSFCSALESVDFGTTPRNTVPTLGYDAFYEIPKSCKIIVPLGMYDEWIVADGWKDLYAAGYKFMGYANAADVAAKRDKTDNIVAADSFQFSEWKFTCDVPEIQAALDANPPTLTFVSMEIPDGVEEYWELTPLSNVGDWHTQDPATSIGFNKDPDAERVEFPYAYFTEDYENFTSVTATRIRTPLAVEGESYVSPVYVTNTINEATADHVKSNDLQLAVAPINNNVNTIWTYVYGETVWIAVTNYMRSVGGVAPSFQLFEVRDGKTNLVYWSAEEIDTRVGDKIDIAMSNIVDTVVTAKADRAWSKYQSMTGADNPQPNDVTIVSTPSIMLSGGYEWQRFVDTGAEVWVLKCNDLITLGADTNAYFRITDLEGETQFAIEKTASKLVDAVPTATGFTTDGNNYFKVTFSGNIQPTIYVSLDLVNSPFVECSATENDYGLTCSWEHDSAANTYTATIAYNAGDGKPSKMFVYGKVLQEGSTVVKHTAPSSFDGGIIIGDVQYSVGTATIDGKTVLTLNPVTRAVSE